MKKIILIVFVFGLFIVFCSDLNKGGKIDKDIYLIQDDPQNIVSIKMPLFYDSEINGILEEYLKQYFFRCYDLVIETVRSNQKMDIDIKEEQYAKYYIELDYYISYDSDDLISIVWEGLCNYKEAAHPNNILITFNMNLKKLERVFLSDSYIITKDLYNDFVRLSVDDITKKSSGEVYPESWGEFSQKICTWENFADGVKYETEIYSYYTKEGVSVSYPVPHSVGDYFITVIPYDILEVYKK